MSSELVTRVTMIAAAVDSSRWNLRHQTVADGQQRVHLAGLAEAHLVLRDTDGDTTDEVDEQDQQAGDRIAADELRAPSMEP